ncbi:unnamed protein product [Nezara viridula]|uniref:Uncharacterized protein n=1 Tax=Nezara viridula TaxID=85310 RepID=A0A9P0HFL9_NEZVI|nr:unnamed protein product [Nezara viridula]
MEVRDPRRYKGRTEIKEAMKDIRKRLMAHRPHLSCTMRLPTPYQSSMGPGLHSSIPTPMSFRHNQPGADNLKTINQLKVDN